jgi:peptidoglycan hydrolase-like protein with peptidoglycan-binding domain
VQQSLVGVISLFLFAALLTSPGGTIEHPLASDRVSGAVSAFGPASDFGPFGDGIPNVASLAAMSTGDGYWIVTLDGTVHAFGDAKWIGDAAGIQLRAPIVDMAPTASGGGYWLTASDGGVFAFGDAAFLGSVPGALPPGAELAKPIVAMTPTPTGLGYWIIGSDGGVFTFGDAPFVGSVPGQLGPGQRLAGDIVDIASAPDGNGYWLAATDGGVFTFGTATYKGSASGAGHPSKVASIAGSGAGYLLAYSDGDVAAYEAGDHGNASTMPGALTAPVVAIDSTPDGGYWLLYGQTTEVRRGSRGPDVAALQQRLTDLGYWLGNIDGAYGGLTSQAVMAFQKWVGLPRTGKADAVTMQQLVIASRPRPATADGNIIELDLTRQLVFVVRDGETLWTFNTSTGSERPYEYDGRWYRAKTPEGRYSVNWERPNGWRVSHLGSLWRPKYFNGGIAFHGSSSVPSYPASHGCSRLTIAAMNYWYHADLAPIGIDVWVYRDRP